MEKIYIIYTTVSGKAEAERIADSIVNAGLAACANIIDNMSSVYRWKGEIRKDAETVLIFKTRSSLVPKLEKEIKKTHSYTVPCFLAIPADHVSKEYMEWIISETSRKKKG